MRTAARKCALTRASVAMTLAAHLIPWFACFGTPSTALLPAAAVEFVLAGRNSPDRKLIAVPRRSRIFLCAGSSIGHRRRFVFLCVWRRLRPDHARYRRELVAALSRVET